MPILEPHRPVLGGLLNEYERAEVVDTGQKQEILARIRSIQEQESCPLQQVT